MVKSKNLYYIGISLLPLIFLSLLLFWDYPKVWGDEFITLNTIQNIFDKGKPAVTVLGNTIPGLSYHALWYPPLYYYIGYVWTRIFGFGLLQMRILSLITGLISIILLYLLTSNLFRSPKKALISSLIFSSDYFVNQAARTARHEMITFLYFFSVLFLFIKNKNNFNYYFISIYAVLSGITLLIHPMGIICILVILCYIILVKKISSRTRIIYSLIFIVFSFTPLLVWLLLIHRDWNFLILQMQSQLAKKQLIKTYVIQMFSFNLSPKFYVISGLILTLLSMFKLFQYKSMRKVDIWIICSLIITLIIIIYGKEMWYLHYALPFLIWSIILLLNKNGLIKIIALPTACLFLFNSSLSLNFGAIKSKVNYTSYKEYVNQIQLIIKNNSIKNSNILISVIPDPSPFLLNGNNNIFSYQPNPLSDAKYYNYLQKMDYAIVNFSETSYLRKYISSHLEKTILNTDQNLYNISIYKLHK